MKYNDEASEWTFKSGKTLYAHSDVLSTDSDGSGVWYGSDGGWNTADLTLEERTELADELIERAFRFRENILAV